MDNKSHHAAQCVKSRVLNKGIDYILSINTFEQKCVVLKCMFQSSRLEYHMKTIGIDQGSLLRVKQMYNYDNTDQERFSVVRRTGYRAL